MKKGIKLLLVFIILITIVGCKKKEENNEPKLADDEVVLVGIKYKLNKEDSEYGIKYKIASNFRKTVLTNAINYFSETIDNQTYFVIRIFQYKNKDIKYAIKDSTDEYLEKKDVKVGDLDYTLVRFKNPVGEDTYTNIYYYTHKKTTYAFVFTASIDLSRLENIFLTQIEY